jgi:periplasmic protein TonB
MAVIPDSTQNLMSDYQGRSPNSRFLAGELPALNTPKTRLGNAFGVSVFTHLGVLLLLLFVISLPDPASLIPSNLMPKDIIWLAQPGPGGGGGGGGNRMPDPPRKAETPGVEKITVPVNKPPKLDPQPPKEDKPDPPLTIPAQPTASAVQELPGVIASLAPPSVSQGSGTGGGAGTGSGSGVGPGTGSGLGPGSGGGTGGGAYHPGNGVTSPKLIKEVKPTYTGDAMRAKIQGIVTMEAVVLPDGSVTSVRITRSLDDRFGLDQEAVNTVRQWRFLPGMRLGQPVPVIIEIEMQFTLR